GIVRKRTLIFSAAVLLGALAGYGAGPFLARANATVGLAARIAREDAMQLEERTLESEAFRDTGGTPEELYAEAAGIERRFRVGGLLLGAFLGAAIVLKLLAAGATPNVREYHIDRAACMSCARCFRACPRERQRLKPPADGQEDDRRISNATGYDGEQERR
ncbi:MAG: hypothetical protein GY844_18100, partial [Bradyrhizobium sp.]|nr:hypothetical protein [Bradyrhizobium sp.]